MSKRAWLVFSAIQAVGCIFASYGTVYSGSSLVRWSWLAGFLVLLPGNLPAMLLDQHFIHMPNGAVFFPVALASNALLWLAVAAGWRKLHRSSA